MRLSSTFLKKASFVVGFPLQNIGLLHHFATLYRILILLAYCMWPFEPIKCWTLCLLGLSDCPVLPISWHGSVSSRMIWLAQHPCAYSSFFFPAALQKSQARDWIHATAVTWTTAVTMPVYIHTYVHMYILSKKIYIAFYDQYWIIHTMLWSSFYTCFNILYYINFALKHHYEHLPCYVQAAPINHFLYSNCDNLANGSSIKLSSFNS